MASVGGLEEEANELELAIDERWLLGRLRYHESLRKIVLVA